MNKQEAIETIEQDKIQVGRFTEITREVNAIQRKIEMVDYVPLETVVSVIDKINEPQKVTIPKFVANFYESIKDDFEDKVYDLCVQFNRDNGELSSEVCGWFDCGKNEPIQTLVKMKLYGYKVEQEKLYTVEIPNPNSAGGKLVLFKQQGTRRLILDILNHNIDKPKYLQLTESEIKQDFEWAWQWAKEFK